MLDDWNDYKVTTLCPSGIVQMRIKRSCEVAEAIKSPSMLNFILDTGKSGLTIIYLFSEHS